MNKYLERFLRSYSSENVVALFSRYKNAAKEITESWAMLEVVMREFEDTENLMAVVVGDGCSPRTRALIAYHTKAFVYSIDPELNLNHWLDHLKKQEEMGYPVKRLKAWKMKIEIPHTVYDDKWVESQKKDTFGIAQKVRFQKQR